MTKNLVDRFDYYKPVMRPSDRKCGEQVIALLDYDAADTVDIEELTEIINWYEENCVASHPSLRIKAEELKAQFFNLQQTLKSWKN